MNALRTPVEPATLRIERVLPGPIERVWEYITDSSKRAKWLAAGPIELTVGGKADLTFTNDALSAEPTPPEWEGKECARLIGKVTKCQPPRSLAFTWGQDGPETSEVTFELEQQGKEVRLILTHRRLHRAEERRMVSSGWPAHLDILEDVLHARTPRPFWSNFTARLGEYDRAHSTE